MPLLDRKGLREDLWTLVDASILAAQDHALVTFTDLAAALAARRTGQKIGVLLENSVKRDDLKPFLADLALIAIRFPAFSDGRGFSLAKALRGFGYQGILRATGPLIPDQFTYALDCGFDEIDLPLEQSNRQPLSQWMAAAGQFTATYQRGYGAASILDQRRAARAGGRS